jgi:hypothetical protein
MQQIFTNLAYNLTPRKLIIFYSFYLISSRGKKILLNNPQNIQVSSSSSYDYPKTKATSLLKILIQKRRSF